jgi:hypothetical protein
MAVTIPKMFTDAFINNKIAELNHSISVCVSGVKRLDEDIYQLKRDEELPFQQISLIYKTFPRNSSREEMERVRYGYCLKYENKIKEIRDKISQMESQKAQLEQQKNECETQKRNCEALLQKTEEERAEEHYQRLLKAKNKDLIKEKHLFFRAKKETLTEEEYKNLTKQFWDMDGYKDTAELARECDNQYRMLKERREEHERADEQRRIEHKRFKAEELERCRIKEAEEQKRREIEEARDRRNRIITGTVLGGIIGGMVFCLLKLVLGDAEPDDRAIFVEIIGIIIGIVFFISGYHKNMGSICTGCGWGCGGLIGGAIIVLFIGAISTAVSLIVFTIIGVVVGALIGMLRNHLTS